MNRPHTGDQAGDANVGSGGGHAPPPHTDRLTLFEAFHFEDFSHPFRPFNRIGQQPCDIAPRGLPFGVDGVTQPGVAVPISIRQRHGPQYHIFKVRGLEILVCIVLCLQVMGQVTCRIRFVCPNAAEHDKAADIIANRKIDQPFRAVAINLVGHCM